MEDYASKLKSLVGREVIVRYDPQHTKVSIGVLPPEILLIDEITIKQAYQDGMTIENVCNFHETCDDNQAIGAIQSVTDEPVPGGRRILLSISGIGINDLSNVQFDVKH
jgi:hypothetical protein